MKLKNKQTGEIRPAEAREDGIYLYDEITEQWYKYELPLLAEWWEYYEEPKTHWMIDTSVLEPVREIAGNPYEIDKEIGNWFSTKEEAELAIRKLKAWKRLKDKGFKFDHIRSIDGVSINHKDLGQYTIIAYADEDGCDQECLDLLFSGGEE